MSVIGGKDGKVMYGSVLVASQVEWSMSGFTKASTQIPPAFGDTVATYLLDDVGVPGTLNFSGNRDPGDTTGQLALATVCKAGAGLTNLYLYENTSTFWRVAAGGEIQVNNATNITKARTGVGKITFSGTISGAAMEQVGTGS